MTILKIDGIEYNVLVTEIEENFNILYSENTGRTMSQGARMTLDPLGSFIGHKITVKRKNGYEREFDRLFNYIMKPRYNGIMVEATHDQSTIQYEAYVSSGARSVKKIDPKTGAVYWSELVLNIIPMEAQVLPT